MKRDAKMILAIDVGKLIVERIFGGDRAVLRQHGPQHAGFRRLASHPDVPFSRATLSRYVGVYEVASDLKWIVKEPALTVAHVSAVIGLPLTSQDRLLRAAVEKRWTAKQLRFEAGMDLNAEAAKAPPPVMRLVRTLERLHASPHDFGHARDLREEHRDRIRRAVEGALAWCEAVRCWLRAGTDEN